jgi:hypothetical protein
MPEFSNGGALRFSNSQAAFEIPSNDHIQLDGMPSLTSLMGRGTKYVNDNVEIKPKFSAIG